MTNLHLKKFTVSHSPDADDRFMFWPLRDGLIDTYGYTFDFSEFDTSELNKVATNNIYDICAISAGHYPEVAQMYQPLLTGFSLGENYGPLLLTSKELSKVFSGKEIKEYSNIIKSNFSLCLSPGVNTTAHNIANYFNLIPCMYQEISITPVENVFKQLNEKIRNSINAFAIVIHEGRLLYSNYNLEKIADLGELWYQKTGASLPLGLNVIRSSIPLEDKKILAKLMYNSCKYALENVGFFIKLATDSSSKYFSNLNKEQISEYLNLYANEKTLLLPLKDRQSFIELVSKIKSQIIVNEIDWISPLD